jgi:hypothetical protein
MIEVKSTSAPQCGNDCRYFRSGSPQNKLTVKGGIPYNVQHKTANQQRENSSSTIQKKPLIAQLQVSINVILKRGPGYVKITDFATFEDTSKLQLSRRVT